MNCTVARERASKSHAYDKCKFKFRSDRKEFAGVVNSSVSNLKVKGTYVK